MKEVERFEMYVSEQAFGRCSMNESATGRWVKHEDYAALQQQLRESREKMEVMLVDNVTLKSIVPTAPGLYAIRYLDNWDGEGHSYFMIARLESGGKWTCEESGKALLEYEGDKVIQAWPLFDVATPATDEIIREIRAEGIDMLVADKVFEWMDSYSADASKFAAQLRTGSAEGGV